MPRDREQEQIKAVLDQVESETSRHLRAEVEGDDITVTMPGTAFSVTHEKRADSPQLVMTNSRMALSVTTSAASEFRARAWPAANDKARELVWIV